MGSLKLATEVKGIKSKLYYKVKMAQPTTTYRRVPTGSVNLRVPKLVGSKWVYEYPVSAAQKPKTESEPIQSDPRNEYREIPIQSRNHPREIPAETQKPAEKPTREDWRGPWPHDNLGPKPRLVGGKLVKPKFIDY